MRSITLKLRIFIYCRQHRNSIFIANNYSKNKYNCFFYHKAATLSNYAAYSVKHIAAMCAIIILLLNLCIINIYDCRLKDYRRGSMGKKDKRIKGCPDPECARHNERYKYKSTDRFCTLCGSQLVYVCAKCFEEIEDTGDQRRYCENCKPKQSEDGAGSQKPPKEKKKKEKKEKKASGKGKETVARSVAVIKGKAPQIKERAVQIAKDPKVQRAALEVAEIAKDGIKHRKTRRVVGVLIRAAKK